MNALNEFYNRMEARKTPQGRQFEAKIITFDCYALILGAIGLAISFPLLVYLGGRGRDGDYSPPPAQIPAGAANAPGSHLG